MITLKSAREIEAMDRAGDFLASIHIGLRDLLKPGVDMWEVEEYVRRRCKEENVLPLQIGVEGSIMDYPYATCCGLNDEVAHAFPRHYILKDGDLLKVDMGLSEPIDKSVLDVSKLDFDNVAQVKKYTESYTGGLADSCWAYAIGTPSDEVKNLMEVTREAMYLGIEQAVVGNRIGDIGAAVLRDRRDLSEDGVVLAVATVDFKSKMILAGPDILSRGFIYMRESGDLIRDSQRILFNAIRIALKNKDASIQSVNGAIVNALRPFLYEKTEREPIIIPMILTPDN